MTQTDALTLYLYLKDKPPGSLTVTESVALRAAWQTIFTEAHMILNSDRACGQQVRPDETR